MNFRCWVEVDLDAIGDNTRQLKSLAGRSLFMAVVKANAYGHGALEVSREALRAGADRLAVATMDEALFLREQGITAPLLVLGRIDPGRIPEAIEWGVTLTLTSVEDLRALGLATQRYGSAIAHLKVDTGMGRLGVPPSRETAREFLEANAFPNLYLEGVFTHFAEADVPESPYTQRQFQVFQSFLGYLQEAGLRIPLRHAANTAALLNFPDTCLDMVRVGIGLYGLYPAGKPQGKAVLRPSMTWKASVSQVKKVAPGQCLSYGRLYQAASECDVATLGVGYADGYTRRLTRPEVILGGHRVPVVGRICMDQMMVLPVTPVRPGDTAILMGALDGISVPCERLAEWSHTINYEIVCGISARVPRVYLRGQR